MADVAEAGNLHRGPTLFFDAVFDGCDLGVRDRRPQCRQTDVTRRESPTYGGGVNITDASAVTIPVSDQDRAKDFYASQLGFEVVPDQQLGPVRWFQVAPKGAQTSFALATGEQGFARGSSTGTILDTSDLDADCAASLAAGVAVQGPTDQPWGRQATLTDPDGNSYVLRTPAPASV